jgi:hypothetical protein
MDVVAVAVATDEGIVLGRLLGGEMVMVMVMVDTDRYW